MCKTVLPTLRRFAPCPNASHWPKNVAASLRLCLIPRYLHVSLTTCSLWATLRVLHSATLRCDPFGMPAAVRVVILKVSARRNVFFYEPPYGVSLKGMGKKDKKRLGKKESI